MTTATIKSTTCTCTEPYSQRVEPATKAAQRRVSNVDAYGHALAGARSVFRCVHGREMTWDEAAGSYRVVAD